MEPTMVLMEYSGGLALKAIWSGLWTLTFWEMMDFSLQQASCIVFHVHLEFVFLGRPSKLFLCLVCSTTTKGQARKRRPLVVWRSRLAQGGGEGSHPQGASTAFSACAPILGHPAPEGVSCWLCWGLFLTAIGQRIFRLELFG